MEAHELVEALRTRQALEKRGKRLDEAEELAVGTLLNKCSRVADGLTTGKFCNNEFGHIEFSAKTFEFSPHGEPARFGYRVDVVYPIFVGVDGQRNSLGQIGRKSTSWGVGESEGWVDAWITLGGERSRDIDTEPLTPADPRWEAVFKPFETAVTQLTEEQA